MNEKCKTALYVASYDGQLASIVCDIVIWILDVEPPSDVITLFKLFVKAVNLLDAKLESQQLINNLQVIPDKFPAYIRGCNAAVIAVDIKLLTYYKFTASVNSYLGIP